MRKILLAAAASAAVLSAPGLLTSANALTLPSQSTVREAADTAQLTPENVRWVCRHGYYGRRHCWWEPGYRRHWRYRYY